MITPTDLRNIIARPYWFKQVCSDLERHEGFRQFAYPDPLSFIGKNYSNPKYKWGFRPARQILAELGLSEAQGRPWTVGHGFTAGVNVDSSMTKEQSLRRLGDEIMKHVQGLDNLLPNWQKTFPLYAATVVANLAYNIGIEKLAKFDTTLSLLNQGKYAMAGINLRKTAWFKQVKSRGLELVQRLESGKIEQEHLV